jgi:glycosyltransferase involved in cell wall biosynthesis
MLAHTCYLRDPRVRREAETLAEVGVEVHVICLSEQDASGKQEPRLAVVKGVRLHRLPLKRKRGSLLRYVYEYFATGLLGGLTLTMMHLRRRLDVVHIHNMPDLLVLSAIVPRLSGAKVVLDVHDPMPELFMSWDRSASNKVLVSLLRLQEKLSCALAHRVVSVNESMRDNLRSKGVADSKIFILNNFPDRALFPLLDSSSNWPRSRDSLVLLYCGTITEHYDLGLAVKAMARLSAEVPVRLRIVGEGNKLNEVLDLASKLGVRGSVEPVGLVPIDKVRDEMRQADVGISCHRAGVFGDLYFSTKIIEYLTQGLPVLAPRTRTISKYLPDDSMFFFEPGNEDDMVDRLRFMWQNPAEVLKRLATARGLLPQLSWQSEKDKFISFYASLTTPAGGIHRKDAEHPLARTDTRRRGFPGERSAQAKAD